MMTIAQLETEIYLACPDAQHVEYVLRYPDPEDGTEAFAVDDGRDTRLVQINRETLEVVPL